MMCQHVRNAHYRNGHYVISSRARQIALCLLATFAMLAAACGDNGSGGSLNSSGTRSAATAPTTLATTTTTSGPTSLTIQRPDGYRYSIVALSAGTYVADQKPGLEAVVVKMQIQNLLPRAAPNVLERVGLGLRLPSDPQCSAINHARPNITLDVWVPVNGYCVAIAYVPPDAFSDLYLTTCPAPSPAATEIIGDVTSPSGSMQFGKCVGDLPESMGLTPASIAAFFWDPLYTQSVDTEPTSITPCQIAFCTLDNLHSAPGYMHPELWTRIPLQPGK